MLPATLLTVGTVCWSPGPEPSSTPGPTYSWQPSMPHSRITASDNPCPVSATMAACAAMNPAAYPQLKTSRPAATASLAPVLPPSKAAWTPELLNGNPPPAPAATGPVLPPGNPPPAPVATGPVLPPGNPPPRPKVGATGVITQHGDTGATTQGVTLEGWTPGLEGMLVRSCSGMVKILIDCSGSLAGGAVGGCVGNADTVAGALLRYAIVPVKYAELTGGPWRMHGAELGFKVVVVAMALFFNMNLRFSL